VAGGASLLVGGIVLDFVLERYNVFKLLENSPYPISWADVFYPPVYVLLCLTGILLSLGGPFHRNTTWGSLGYSTAMALPLTVLYTIFFVAIQFVATGADRLGECPGLDQAATKSGVIPESQWRGQAAVGCGVERRGMFLSYYNDMTVYGVTDTEAQQSVLDEVAKQQREAHTHAMQVSFFEKENVSTRKESNGVIFQKAAPVKLIRVVNIG
jgi:hypothetical protein